MKFKMFSIVVGTNACIAKCPFCVSCENINSNTLIQPEINWRNFNIGANLANRSDVDTVMLTSRGEPLLFPNQITNYLYNLKPYNFPFVELQTNGILFKSIYEKDNGELLDKWYNLGLTTIIISVVSNEYEKNKTNYIKNSKGEYMNLEETIELLHKYKFSVRLTCVLCKGITSSVDEIKSFINYAKENKVEQVTLRPLNEEFRRESIKPWINEHLLSDIDKNNILEFLNKEGTQLLILDGIGTVYDVNGQNVMFSVPLTINTRSTDPENRRNLIFFPDGHLRYEWEKEGGILL